MDHEGPVINNLLLMKVIDVRGDHVAPAVAKEDLAAFRSVLTAYWPGANIKVKASRAATNGAYVLLTPVAQPWNDFQCESLAQTERDIIMMWFDLVLHNPPY